MARLGTARFRHAGAVHAVAFSADGKLLAASSDDKNMVVIWERATGRKLRELPTTGVVPATGLRFSSDGKLLFGAYAYGKDAKRYAWEVATGADARDLPKETRAGEAGLIIQFDGQSVGLWDTVQKKQLWSVTATREKNYPGLPMGFSADGKLFAVETPPQVISVYESVSGKLVHRLEADVGKIYYSLAFSPDRQTVAASNWDGSLRLWDLDSGRQRARIARIQGGVTRVFFAPDSKVFATGGGNNAHAVMLWETATGKPIEAGAGHTSPIQSLSFSPDGQTVATSSWLRGDPVVRLWDPGTGRLRRSFETTNMGGVSAIAFSPDGRTLAACGWGGATTVQIWNVAAGRARHVLAGHEAGCTSVAFSSDGKRLASSDAYYNKMGSYEGRICIWDSETGSRLREIRGTPGAIQQVLFTHDGRHVLAAADGVHVYDAETGEAVGKVFQANVRIWRLALSADGRLLATADNRGPVRLWEMATRREIALKLPDAIGYDVSLSADGRTLLAIGPKGVVAFHWPSGATVGRLSGEASIGNRLALAADGRRLATAGSADSAALIWDVAKLANRPLPAVIAPDRAALRRWWVDLGDDNPHDAYHAVWRFASVPEQAVPYFAKMLRPVERPESAHVTRLIDDLDSGDFNVRDRASRELERLGEAVVPALRKALKGNSAIEQSRRAKELLATLDGPVPGLEQLRAVRAVAALEQTSGPQASKLLAELAAGAPGARLTQEATAALERLKKSER